MQHPASDIDFTRRTSFCYVCAWRMQSRLCLCAGQIRMMWSIFIGLSLSSSRWINRSYSIRRAWTCMPPLFHQFTWQLVMRCLWLYWVTTLGLIHSIPTRLSLTWLRHLHCHLSYIGVREFSG